MRLVGARKAAPERRRREPRNADTQRRSRPLSTSCEALVLDEGGVVVAKVSAELRPNPHEYKARRQGARR
jgi:hypothetical protein